MRAVVESYPYNRPDAARRHAIEVGGIVVLKGSRWIVYGPEEKKS